MGVTAWRAATRADVDADADTEVDIDDLGICLDIGSSIVL
jgi:hypothetical protein